MALHLTLDKGDRVLLSCGVIIDIRRTGKHVQLSIEAPPEIRIDTMFQDIKKQLKMGLPNHE